jgi:hypothetical protein
MTDAVSSPDVIGGHLADGLARLGSGAVRVASEGLAHLPADVRERIQRSVDAGQCALTVQIDLPSGAVRLLADGPGWIKPQCLFAVELPEPESAASH